jgi:hypothetical protein
MKTALRLIFVINLFLLFALNIDTFLRPRVFLDRILPQRILSLTTVEERSSIAHAVSAFPGPPYFSTALVLAVLALVILAFSKDKPDSN